MSSYLVIMNDYNHIINPWIIQNTKIAILLIDNYNQILILQIWPNSIYVINDVFA
jgi:hypothetical protein